jgi:hypothetical protein
MLSSIIGWRHGCQATSIGGVSKRMRTILFIVFAIHQTHMGGHTGHDEIPAICRFDGLFEVRIAPSVNNSGSPNPGSKRLREICSSSGSNGP